MGSFWRHAIRQGRGGGGGGDRVRQAELRAAWRCDPACGVRIVWSAYTLDSHLASRQEYSARQPRVPASRKLFGMGDADVMRCGNAARERAGSVHADPLRLWVAVECDGKDAIDTKVTLPVGSSATLRMPIRSMVKPTLRDGAGRVVVERVRREAEALAVEIARGGEFVFAME